MIPNFERTSKFIHSLWVSLWCAWQLWSMQTRYESYTAWNDYSFS